ncbi:MAG TPA: hypothetical protein VGN74_04035 [Brevundimonas sp.]|jgi:hypothetical protein|uniref:hypothetical protein n=1 Tax=Brevundimonas sp. TaxID=1871086 RepID=UPI002E129AB1|nr:hypothetical protein [Brevundimonas sp.]
MTDSRRQPLTPEARDADPSTPPSRPAEPLPPGRKPDQLEQDAETRREALVDQGVEETFPASDPATGKHIT